MATALSCAFFMALVLVPRYLFGGFTTLPEYLETRFDPRVRHATAVLFLLGYGLVTIPSVLYSGSLAVLQIVNVPDLLGLDRDAVLTVTVWAIGLLGAAYAIIGRLKAVAVSDTLNGMGLLIVGVLVPVLGLLRLGEGSVPDGLAILPSDERTHGQAERY